MFNCSSNGRNEKSPGSAFSKTMIKQCKATSWSNLLEMLNLPVYPPRSQRRNTDKLKVTIHCDEL